MSVRRPAQSTMAAIGHVIDDMVETRLQLHHAAAPSRYNRVSSHIDVIPQMVETR
jgi:hypothetical protein